MKTGVAGSRSINLVRDDDKNHVRLVSGGLTVETVAYQLSAAERLQSAIEPEHWYICCRLNHD